MSEGRTFAEEQEAVSAAVINVLHALMNIAADDELEPTWRIVAAEAVLEYGLATAAPPETEFDDEEAPAEEAEESEGEDEAC